ncbi:MAG: hypothetical protein EBT58_08015, partial [Betaproteobacteria bacterium]|nr:hypothetical protein [Betaproteobacteria bacterium]
MTTSTLPTDSIAPSVAISTDKTKLKAGEVATLTFTFTEAVTDFVLSDVTFSGGGLANFAGSGSIYSAVFTPSPNSTIEAVVAIASGRFSDAAGNLNVDGNDYNNKVTLSVDTVKPSVSITSDKTRLKANETSIITFTLSESSTDFTLDDVLVSGGKLANFNGSGKTYSAIFTPTTNSTTSGVVSIAPNKFSDSFGNLNQNEPSAANSITLAVDTVLPTVTITSAKPAIQAGQSTIVYFQLSEPSLNFSLVDLSVVGGQISNFQGSGNSYQAVFSTDYWYGGPNWLISVTDRSFSDLFENDFQSVGGHTPLMVRREIAHNISDRSFGGVALIGSSQDDTLIWNGGNDFFVGGGGNDELDLTAYNKSAVTTTRNTAGLDIVTVAGNVLSLVGVEKLVFKDGQQVISPAPISSLVYDSRVIHSVTSASSQNDVIVWYGLGSDVI